MNKKLDIIVMIALIVSVVASVILSICFGIDLEANYGLVITVDRFMSMCLGYILCVLCRGEMIVSRKTEG